LAATSLVGVNDDYVVTLIETIDRANLDAIGIFALDTRFNHDIGHAALLWVRGS
jgi:hypothetical protein